MPEDIYIKHLSGTQADRPESENGQILYESDTRALFVDQNNQRTRYNPPRNWNENSPEDPSYIENKPELGTVSLKNIAQSLEDKDAIPTVGMMSEALEASLYWYEPVKTYGVVWDYSDPSTKLSRTGDAKNFVDPIPATSVSGTGSSPFDDVYPWCDMREVNILSDGTIIEKDDSRFSYNNDTMVWIPEFYYKVYKDKNAQTHTWNISESKAYGYKLHPGSGKYVSKYHISGLDSVVYSKTGMSPLRNITKENISINCKNKGKNWRMLDISVWSAIQMLYLVEFANFNSQQILGSGWNVGYTGTAGGTNGAVYHTIKANGMHNSFRYIEDPYSNVRDFADGYVAINKYAYIETNPEYYEDNILQQKSISFKLPENGYITNFAYNNNCDFAFIPETSSSDEMNSNRYVTDATYSRNDKSYLFIGGLYADYQYYGMFYFGGNSQVALTDDGIGSRLIYDPSN